ncbi:hypothetical protein [Neorhizobium sp. DT-125]|uniref:hypothetical protein n=1 Tax=Neorhizobium sp. DT-125 TaxID=3396163 RepID=UPI003F1D826D
MSEASDFERRDVSARLVVLALVGLFLLVSVFFGIVALIVFGIAPEEAPPRFGAENLRAGPRLEVSPVDDQRRAEAAIQARLQGYAWVDRNAGRAKIPIERAMEIIATQGWPDEERKEGGP